MNPDNRRTGWIVAKAIAVTTLLGILAVLVWRYNLPFADFRDMIQAKTDRLGLVVSTLIFVVLYCLISTAPIPGREVFKLAAAVVFGFFSIIAVWLGEVAAAVVGYVLSRVGGYELVSMLGGRRVTDFNERLHHASWQTVFFLRVIPITPYRFFNFGAGLTDLRFAPYWWGTVTGVLVRTAFFQCLFVIFGDALVERGVSVREVFFASIFFGSTMILIWIAMHRRRARRKKGEAE